MIGVRCDPVIAALITLLGGFAAPVFAADENAPAWRDDVRPVYVPDLSVEDYPPGEWVAIDAGMVRRDNDAPQPFVETLELSASLTPTGLAGTLTAKVAPPPNHRDRAKVTGGSSKDAGSWDVPLGLTSLAIWDVTLVDSAEDAAENDGDGGPGGDKPDEDEPAEDDPDEEISAETERPMLLSKVAMATDGRGISRLLVAKPQRSSAGSPADVPITIQANWAAAGTTLYRQQEFRLRFPQAVTTRLTLRLPAPLVVHCDSALIRPPSSPDEDGLRLWNLELGRDAVTVLRIRPRDAGASPVVAVETSVAAQLSEEGLSWTANLSLRDETASNGSAATAIADRVPNLTIEIPEDCLVDSVLISGVPQPLRQRKDRGRRLLSLHLGRLPVVVRLEGRRPSGGVRRRIPHPTVRNTQLRSSSLSIRCEPLLEVRQIDAANLRQVSASLQSRQGDYLEFEATGPQPRLAVVVGPPRASLTSELLTVVEYDPLATRLLSLLRLSTESGSTTQVRLQLPEGWEWIDFTSESGPEILRWSLDDENGTPVADLMLASPLATRRPLSVRGFAVRPSDDSARFPLPLVRPQSAEPSQSHLLIVAEEVDAIRIDTPGAVEPESDDELIDEASLLVRFLDPQLANAAESTRRAFRVLSIDADLERIERPVEAAEPDVPQRLTPKFPPLADLAIASMLAAPGGDEHFHVATFTLHGHARTDPPAISLPSDARWISLEVDGVPTQVLAEIRDKDTWRRPLLQTPNAGQQTYRVHYASSTARSGWLATTTLPRPSLDIPDHGLSWSINRGRSQRLVEVPGVIGRIEGLDRLSWQTRLFGPIGRRRRDAIFQFRELLGPDRTADAVRPVTIEGAKTPERLSVRVFDADATTRLAWTALSFCLLFGVAIRRAGLSTRGRAAALWAPLCFGGGWFAPAAVAPIFGAAGVGTVLGMLIPRRLIVPQRDALTDDGSTSIVAVPSAIASTNIAGVSLVALLTAAAFGQSAAPDGPNDVLVPYEAAPPLPADAEVFVRRGFAQRLAERQNADGLLIRSAVYKPQTLSGRRGLSATWIMSRTATCTGMRLPISPGVSLADAVTVDGRTAIPIPTERGELFVPFDDRVAIDETFEVVVRFLLADEAANGRCVIWTPHVLDQRWVIAADAESPDGKAAASGVREPGLPELLQPPPLVEERGSTRLPPSSSLVCRVGTAKSRPLSFDVSLVASSQPLGMKCYGELVVENATLEPPLEIRFPRRLDVVAASLVQPNSFPDPNGDDATPASPAAGRSDRTTSDYPQRSSLPLERRGGEQRLIAPVQELGQPIVVRFEANLPSESVGRRVRLPLRFVASQRERTAEARQIDLAIAAAPGFDVNVDAGIPAATLPESTLTALVPRLLPADAKSVVADPGLRLTGPETPESVVLDVSSPMATTRASVFEEGTFQPGTLRWRYEVNMEVAERVWQRELTLDRRLTIEQIRVVQDGVNVLGRWSRPRDRRGLTDRATLLFEEPRPGSQTLIVEGRLPLRSPARTVSLPRIGLVDANVADRELTLRNQVGVAVELLDGSGRPLSGAIAGSAPSSITLSAEDESRSEGLRLLADESIAFASGSVVPGGFRIRRADPSIAIETAAIRDAAGRLDLLAHVRASGPGLARVNLDGPVAAVVGPAAAVVDQRETASGLLVSAIISGRDSRTIRFDDVAAPSGDLGSTLPVPDVTGNRTEAAARYVCLPVESRLEPAAATRVDAAEVPRWLLDELDSLDRWLVWRSNGPVVLSRMRVAQRSRPRRALHRVWIGEGVAEGQSEIEWAASTPIEWSDPIDAAIIDGQVVAAGPGDPRSGFGRRLQLWWTRTIVEGAVVLPQLAANAEATEVVAATGGDVSLRFPDIDGPSSASASQTRTLHTNRRMGSLAVATERQFASGTGFVLSALVLHLLLVRSLLRASWARQVPNSIARHPWVSTLLFGLVWWLLFSPSVVGMALAIAGLVGIAAKAVQHYRPLAVRAT